jgi:hypothetical protein
MDMITALHMNECCTIRVYLRLGVSGMGMAGVTISFCCSLFTLDLAVHVYHAKSMT